MSHHLEQIGMQEEFSLQPAHLWIRPCVRMVMSKVEHNVGTITIRSLGDDGGTVEKASISEDLDCTTPAASGIDDTSSEDEPISRSTSSSDLKKITSIVENPYRKLERKGSSSLQERARIPPSIVFVFFYVLILEYASGVYSMFGSVIAPSIAASVQASCHTLAKAVAHLFLLFTSFYDESVNFTYSDYGRAIVGIMMVSCILYVLIYAPLRAGMWTQPSRVKRHKVHRYMGLFFLIQYGLAWTEYITDYDGRGRDTFMMHTIAMNGIIQAISAYFSFKVLPELKDAGYFSDRAVLSRSFVHENIFYQVMVFHGSVYHNDQLRKCLQSSNIGRVLDFIVLFFPYVLYRPMFPTTRFRDAGTSMSGRSSRLERFYATGTTMIKFFYLWAKYFLGFFINWCIYLDFLTPSNWKFVRGLFLLNVGTVSIAIFLHTLRFKKVLPPQLTFSIYIVQIYATFSAIPYAYNLFSSHKKLCVVALSGILANMTRSWKMHTLWCCITFVLLVFAPIEW